MVTYLNVAEIICFEFENWKFGLENWNKKDIEKERRWETVFYFLVLLLTYCSANCSVYIYSF